MKLNCDFASHLFILINNKTNTTELGVVGSLGKKLNIVLLEN